MTVEARVLFVLLVFVTWAFVGLIAWAAIAVLRRGHGAMLALPVSLAGACLFGVTVPVAGLRDAAGFFLSLPAALVGAMLGYAFVVVLLQRLAPGAETERTGSVEKPPRE